MSRVPSASAEGKLQVEEEEHLGTIDYRYRFAFAKEVLHALKLDDFNATNCIDIIILDWGLQILWQSRSLGVEFFPEQRQRKVKT